MALLIKSFRISIVSALVAIGVTAVNAQSPNQPNSLDRFSDMVQSGVPCNTKFVFCDREDCPKRSIKHLYVPSPPPPATREPITPAPQSIQPPEELSYVKAPAEKKPLKKKQKKPTIQHECEPVSKPK